MYIIIVGLGGIGRNLAAISIDHGESVAVIDQDESRCNDILEEHDVLAIAGNATNKSILEDAGIDRADALVATTSDDAVNLMTCWLAKSFEVPNVVSIVNQKEHSDFFKQVGIIISENPDELVAGRLYYWVVDNPKIGQLASIPDGTIFELMAEEGGSIIDKKIRDMDVRDFVIIAIKRAGGELIIPPTGDTKIRPDDTLTVFTKKKTEKDAMKSLTTQLKKIS